MSLHMRASSFKNGLMVSCCLLAIVLLDAVVAYPARSIQMPSRLYDIQNFQLPESVRNPNIGVTIDDSVSLSVDPRTGEVNLAGGVSHGFGVDAGILTKTGSNTVSFTSGKGKATGNVATMAFGNGGADASGSVVAIVPSVLNGLSFNTANALTNAIGRRGSARGTAVGHVGNR